VADRAHCMLGHHAHEKVGCALAISGMGHVISASDWYWGEDAPVGALWLAK
jgi:hypothetical protein